MGLPGPERFWGSEREWVKVRLASFGLRYITQEEEVSVVTTLGTYVFKFSSSKVTISATGENRPKLQN